MLEKVLAILMMVVAAVILVPALWMKMSSDIEDGRKRLDDRKDRLK